MALADAVQGGVRPSQEITWTREDGTAMDLTGATITGRLRNQTTQATRAITGSLVLVTPASGLFRWDYSTADVADAGLFAVQFAAAFVANPTPAKTFAANWLVVEAI